MGSDGYIQPQWSNCRIRDCSNKPRATVRRATMGVWGIQPVFQARGSFQRRATLRAVEFTPPPKYFNTAGPCRPDWHYMVPPLPRVPQAPRLVAQGAYWVLHAPRQSGKTTFLREFARTLTAEQDVAAVYASCEAAEAKGDDDVGAQEVIVRALEAQLAVQLPVALQPPPFVPPSAQTRLSDFLAHWCSHSPRRVVLLLDEIDAVRGQSLISVLRQLRAGFPERPYRAPWSLVLCGLRDVREYKAASGGDASRLGSASPFNVKVESVRLTLFEPEDVKALLAAHTESTGQPFEPAALERLTDLAGGQPWLVNALAREVVEKLGVLGPISAAHIEEAKERLVLARATHLDSLVHKLSEDRVKRVLGPLLAGESVTSDPIFNDDVSYVVDLGIVKSPPLRIANPIYTEVIARVLSEPASTMVFADPRSFVRPDGRFDLDVLLREFAAFWLEQGDALADTTTYHESGAQLVMMAFLQRVVNGRGTVAREYGIGRRRIDLLVSWPFTDEHGKRQLQREAIELKVWRDGRKDPLEEGLKQLDEYLTRVGLETGILVLFDRRTTRPPLEERLGEESATSPKGRAIRVLRA